MDIEQATSDHETKRDLVRIYCAEQLRKAVEALEPYVDGTMGEIMPGHVAAYTAAVKELGRLFQAQQAPQDASASIPAERVDAMIAAARAEAAEQARVEERARVEAGQRLSLEAAREQVSAQLSRLDGR